MKIAVIGGGPAGLYFSILTKLAQPEVHIEVFERNKPDDAFGFGVVFSDETLSEFLTKDKESYQAICENFSYWDDIIISRDDDQVTISGNGFCGCSRKTLLNLLQERARSLGILMHFEVEIKPDFKYNDWDYVIAADGVNSQIRNQFSKEFGTEITYETNRFIWMGSTKPLDAFTYFFRTTPAGTIMAHTYQYEEGKSTWIFECEPETWKNLQFDSKNTEETQALLEEIFAQELDGHSLISNKSEWRQFPTITNKNWNYQNIILLGDAKATAHFSIGSGTKMAMECAMVLSDSIVKHGKNKQKVFSQYEELRRNKVSGVQNAAKVSQQWFSNVQRHMHHDFMQFAFGVMTRSNKVTYENLSLRDKEFTNKVLVDFNCAIGNFKVSVPAAFTPIKLRGVKIKNRIAMSSMSQYSAEKGLVSDWHLVHYGSRATQGVGLIFTEAVAVSKVGRITLGCAGIWNENQVLAWKRIVDYVHKNTKSKMAIQLGHSGRKGSVKIPNNGSGKPLENKGWQTLSASAIPFEENWPIPKEMNQSDMEEVIAQFINAAMNADLAGFDMIELQAHHGFLLGSFLSPLTNKRKDKYGGSIQNRLKFPLLVFQAIREVFHHQKPISVRISATDWCEGGISADEVIVVAQAFKDAGADIINVSTGNTVSNQNIKSGRMWQAAYSDVVRNSVHIPTITSGGIQNIDQINTLLLSGKADIIALGSPLLIEPNFVRNAQAHEGYLPDDIPNQYLKGVHHLFPLRKYQRQENEKMKRLLKPDSHKKQQPE